MRMVLVGCGGLKLNSPFMAIKKKVEEPVPANISFPEMEAAIPKIERRINDLKNFNIDAVTKLFDPTVGAVEHELEALLVSVFGTGTVEHKRYEWSATRLNPSSWSYMNPTPLSEVKSDLRESIARVIAQLETIKKGFLEDLEDAGRSTSGKTLKAYQGLELHPAIERAAGQLFRDGHYANAVEDAAKALNALVRLNSGVDDKDGTKLMETVFSPGSPILRVNALADQSDQDEQKGFMMMFSGAVAGLRNPRAHKIIKDDSEMALEFVAYISLLAKIADKATK